MRMGVIDLEGLVSDREALNEAVEIGAMPRQQVTAMWVDDRGDDSSALVYKSEIGPLIAGFAPRGVETETFRHHWWRLEIKIHIKDLPSEIGAVMEREGPARVDCVIAVYPYSVGWIGRSRFKRSSRKERPAMPAAVQSPGHLFEHLERLPHDYWETGNYLTAGFDALSALVEDPANMPRESMLILGICHDAQGRRAALTADARVTDLIERTKHGNIYFGMKGVPAVPLHPEVRDAARHHMDQAIQQALAGPHKDNNRWIDREVFTKVDHIYRLHLNNHNRRLDREPDRVPFDDDRDHDPD
jgi:hypothetical protein